MSRIVLVWLVCLCRITGSAQIPVWDNMGSGFNASGTTLLQWNNYVYAGGSFTQAGSANAQFIAKWSGLSWSAVGAGFNSSVTCLATYNNQLFAGGTFTSSGSTVCLRVAKWNGAAWENVGGGILGTAVYGMQEYNGKLYVTGKFHQAGSAIAYNIASWDGTNWNAVGVSGFNQHPFYYGLCMEVWNDRLYIGGLIDSADNQEIGYIVEWDGNTWSNMQHGLNGPVNALESYNGLLYAGGWFTATWTAQQTLLRLASWNGSNWSPAGAGMNDGVLSLFGYGDQLYIGGWFTGSASVPASFLVKWDGNAYGSTGSLSGPVTAICGDEGIIYVTGSFQLADNLNVNCVAKYSVPGVAVPEPGQSSTYLNISPNPSAGVFNFQCTSDVVKGSIGVYNCSGMLLQQVEVESDHWMLDLTSESQGIYYYVFSNNGNVSCGTIILH